MHIFPNNIDFNPFWKFLVYKKEIVLVIDATPKCSSLPKSGMQ